MNKKPPLTLFIFLVVKIAFSQKTEFAAQLIPDSLTENSNTVIRENLLEISIEDVDQKIIKHKRVITILNKEGNSNIDLYQHYNNDTKINKLSARIYDAYGNELKKYSKGKFIDVSAVDGGSLYSDAKVKYVDYTPTTYPYTIVFYSETQDSSTGFIPKWYPISGYSISIQKSIYKINNPKDLIIRKKEKNLDNYTIKNLSEGNTIHYELTNQPAKKYERGSLPFNEIMPSVSTALNSFSLKGVKGSASNWLEFGKWMNTELLSGRTQLKESTINKIRGLVKDAKTDIEKAKIIYKHMQDRTRYISVQVGIGGWEPIPANEVDRLGYGDCKGLTNYTKALLEAVGVTSYYSVVYADTRRDIDKDFSSIQGNHVILNIPNGSNDVWLECTSQIHPFGFLGDFTDDRNVLVITPEGGIIKRTPAYKNETNLQTVKANIILDETGNISATIKRTSKGIQYNNKFRTEIKSSEEMKKHYKSEVWDYNNNLEVVSFDINNDKKNITFTENVAVKIEHYASINDSEYIFRPNVFNKHTYIPKRYRNRTQPFKVSRGFLDKDEYTITIPKAYKIDLLPEKEINSKYGTYKISFERVNNNTISYKKYFLLKDGVYPKEEYKNYRKFLKSVSKLENLRIALVKK